MPLKVLADRITDVPGGRRLVFQIICTHPPLFPREPLAAPGSAPEAAGFPQTPRSSPRDLPPVGGWVRLALATPALPTYVLL